MRELNVDAAIAAGGWDPRWARVLVVATDGDAGAAIVDTNGDGADVDLDVYTREPTGEWVPGPSGNVGEQGWCQWDGGVACYGRAARGEAVTVAHRASRHEVITAATGWWLFVTAASATDSREPPSRVE